jgi:hypothetical protein
VLGDIVRVPSLFETEDTPVPENVQAMLVQVTPGPLNVNAPATVLMEVTPPAADPNGTA